MVMNLRGIYMRRSKVWQRLLSVFMVVLLVVGLYTPVVSAEETVPSPLQLDVENNLVENTDSVPNPESNEPVESVIPQNPSDDPDLAITTSNGRVMMGTTPISDLVFSLHTVEATPQWYDFRTDANGVFSYGLPDGTYQVDGIWLEPKWYPLNQQFTIQNGQLQGANELIIQIDKAVIANVTGGLMKDGKGLAGITFSLHSLDSGNWYDATTNSFGEFEFTLPDGKFQVDGIWIAAEPKWYVLNQTFQVTNGKLVGAEYLKLNISSLPVDTNVTGVLRKNDQPLPHIWFSMSSTTNGEVNWYDAQSDAQGRFHFSLPNGTYKLEGIWDPAESHWYNLQREFHVDGSLAIDLNVAAIAFTNFTGILTKGESPLSDVTFSLRSTDKNTWYNLKTDKNGAFSHTLPDGNYLLEGIWLPAEGTWYELRKSFTVSGTFKLAINVLDATKGNVKGKLLKGAEPLGKTIFSVKNKATDQWFDAQSNEYGQFEMNLPNGDYLLAGVWVNKENQWYELNQSFTVAGALQFDIDVLNSGKNTPNLTGVLKRGYEILPNLVFSFHTTTEDVKWYDVKTNAVGEFQMVLPDGNYQIDGIWIPAENKWYELNLTFSISSGKLVGTEKLSIQLGETADNVVGTVTDSLGGIKQAEIFIYSQGDSFSTWVHTDDTGKFSSHLEDGVYGIAEIKTEHSYHSNNYQGDTLFSIKNGKMLVEGQEKSELSIHFANINVQSIVYAADGSLINDTQSVFIRSVDANPAKTTWSEIVDGKASFRLADGEYMAEFIFSTNFRSPLKQPFTVLNGEVYIEKVKKDQLEFKLHPITLKGKLLEEGTLLPNTGLVIYKTGQSSFDPTLMYRSDSDENGEFSFGLPDGEYILSYAIVNEEHVYIQKNFEIRDGQLYVNGAYSELLHVSVPKLFQLKVLLEENGNILRNATSLDIAGENMNYGIMADVNGDFIFNLPSGQYEVKSFQQNGHVYSINPYRFKIVSGKLFVDGVEKEYLKVPVPPITVKGKVVDQSGQLQKDTQIRLMSADGLTEYQANTNNLGEFQLRFQDGSYLLERIYLKNSRSIITNLPFTVENGKLKLNGQVANELMVTIPVHHQIAGQLMEEGSGGISGAYIYFDHTATKLPDYFATDGEGKFTRQLPNGEYRVSGIEINKKFFTYEWTFTIADGKIFVNGVEQEQLVIVLKPVNFKGSLLVDGISSSNIAVEVREVGSSVRYYSDTDAHGNYEFRLPDGSYEIQQVYLRDHGQWLAHKASFRILDGRLVVNGANQAFMNLDLGKVHLIQGQVNSGGNEVFQKASIIVEFVGQFIATAKGINEDGSFTIVLKDGKHIVRSVSIGSEPSYNVNLEFEIKSGKVFVNDVEETKLLVNILPKSLKGKVAFTEAGVHQEVYVEIYSVTEAKWYSQWTTNKQFEYRLPDGDYRISRVYLKETSKWSTLSPITFTIVKGKLMMNGAEQGELMITIYPSVQGQAEFLYEATNKRAYMTIFDLKKNTSLSASSDASGYFELRLPDGEYFVSSSLYLDEFGKWMIIDDRIILKIVNGKAFVNDEPKQSFTIKIPMGYQLNGSVFENGLPVKNATVQVDMKNGSSILPYTDDNGLFTTTYLIPNGEYTIREITINNIERILANPIQFQFKNGKVIMDGIEKEKLEIKL
jgi:hypothetical protein